MKDKIRACIRAAFHLGRVDGQSSDSALLGDIGSVADQVIDEGIAKIEETVKQLTVKLAMTEAGLARSQEEVALYKAESNAWLWQDDGGDSLETMGNCMEVLIRADSLRELLENRK